MEIIVAGIEGISHKRRTVGLFHHVAAFVRVSAEGPCAAEVIFRSGGTLAGEFIIAVDIEFEFAFAPPVTFQRGQAQICADVMAASLDAVEQDIVLLELGELFPAPLRMEIRCIVGDIGHDIVDLIEESGYFCSVLVFQCDAGGFAERHGQEAVHAALGIDSDGQRIDLAAACEAAQEEVAERAFHGWGFLIIPVHAQDEVAQHEAAGARRIGYGAPDMLDHAAAFDFTKDNRFACGDPADAGRTLASLAQLACGLAGGALLAVAVFPVDRTGAPLAQQGQSAQSVIEEIHTGSSLLVIA